MVDIADFYKEGLELPRKEMPELKKQRRKKSAVNSLPEWKIMGADTETIQGKCWIFSTEKGAYYIDSFLDLIKVLYSKDHAQKWARGKKATRKDKKRKSKSARGLSTKEFFFWNLKFDVNAILHHWEEESILHLLEHGEIIINVKSTKQEPIVEGEMIEIRYLEGKMLEMKPIDWYLGQYKFGPCVWWDISQFYGKRRLNDMAKEYLNETKIEVCFDGSVLDVTQLGDENYRNKYREDIEKYAIKDAILAGRLARKKRNDYDSLNIRFIRPYSLANVAQRNLIDSSKIPTINPYRRTRIGMNALSAAWSAMQGGWFEVSGSGYVDDVVAFDLTSAYPYTMYHLDDVSEGFWIRDSSEECWWEWCENRKPMDIGFAEVFVNFKEGLDFYPLVKTSPLGTLVGPQMISGWFTADEIVEARKWPHTTFIVGEWFRFQPTSTNKPFRNFIKKFYEMKEHSPKNTVSYEVAKIQINSIFGKTCQKTNGRIGSLWNPFYCSTITGFTRSRIAEAVRLQNHKAVSIATDGIVFRRDEFIHDLPPRPLPAPYTLGEWEEDGEGEMLIQMSGVYSIRNESKTKTVFRGSSSYFLRNYRENGLFGFCEDNHFESMLSVTVNKPYSAKEARAKSNIRLMNVFDDRVYSITAVGDSTKRIWNGDTAKTFGDLNSNWYSSRPHRRINGLHTEVDNHGG
tara:strand:+ start:331 stop:2385 length:2055 start_codon:yes stop_codon:yes gene_type:complete